MKISPEKIIYSQLIGLNHDGILFRMSPNVTRFEIKIKKYDSV